MWLYEKNRNNKARYILGEQGENPLVCIGINPSTAEPENLDPTVRTVQRMAGLKGFDGWIMLNLYPQRATMPGDLHEKPNEEWIRENLSYTYRYLADIEMPTVWAAWGTLIGKRNYLPDCLKKMKETIEPFHPKWITIGQRSKHGHPHHPLYLPHAAKIEPFGIDVYIQDQMG